MTETKTTVANSGIKANKTPLNISIQLIKFHFLPNGK